MDPINKRADSYLLYLPLLVLAAVYSVATGEWWAIASLAGAAVGVSFLVPIDRYYGGVTAPLERLALVLDHLLALALLVLMFLAAPGMFDGSAVTVILWIAIFTSLVAYFVRAALAWRRFRHEGVPG